MLACRNNIPLVLVATLAFPTRGRVILAVGLSFHLRVVVTRTSVVVTRTSVTDKLEQVSQGPLVKEKTKGYSRGVLSMDVGHPDARVQQSVLQVHGS